MNEINKFIKAFNSYGEQVIKCFTESNCYWFAYILKSQFNGDIVYNPIIHHFACKIDEHIYDITGDCTEEYHVGWVDWFEYLQIDPVHSKRLIQCCINKEE